MYLLPKTKWGCSLHRLLERWTFCIDVKALQGHLKEKTLILKKMFFHTYRFVMQANKSHCTFDSWVFVAVCADRLPGFLPTCYGK